MTKGEIENQMSGAERFEAMQRRVDSMIKAIMRFRAYRKNKNEGVVAALQVTLWEINDRMRMAWLMGGDRDSPLFRGELLAYYTLVRRMYDEFAESRLLEPSEVTESTQASETRERAQRNRDNPILVWAHDDDCTVDHNPRKPTFDGSKRCPTPEEWDD